MDKDMKRKKLIARLTALVITLIMLAIAMGITMWLNAKYTAAYLPFDLTKMIVINCAGAVLLYLILAHFLKKSDKQ